MPSVNIENGKRIEDLIEISTFSASAHFLVSEHNLTRKTSLTSLRAMFNGDIATTDLNNVYYSVEKLNELFDNVGNEFSKLTERLDSLNLKIQDIYNNLGANIDEFKKKLDLIYAELSQADQDILDYIKEQIRIEKEARETADNTLSESIRLESSTRETNDNALSDRIDNLSSTINSNYNNLMQEIINEANTRSESDNNLSTRITNNTNSINDLSTRITNNTNNISSLSNRVSALENKITISSSAPGSSLATGQIWLQYF